MSKGFTVTVKGDRSNKLDDFHCAGCGYITEMCHGELDGDPDCPECGQEMEIAITQGKNWEFAADKTDSRIITDDRQIHAKYGTGWRETAKNPTRPGGDRKALYFDQARG